MTLHDYEQQIHAALDAQHEPTCQQYAEHAVDNLDADHLRALALAMIMNDSAGQLLALTKIADRIDRQRAEFMEMEAMSRSKARGALEDTQHELNTAYLGAA